jgi:hypothetical protein
LLQHTEELLHDMELVLNREGARCMAGFDACASCGADMSVPIPRQQHHEACATGQVLARTQEHFHRWRDRIAGTTVLLQLREIGYEWPPIDFADAAEGAPGGEGALTPAGNG